MIPPPPQAPLLPTSPTPAPPAPPTLPPSLPQNPQPNFKKTALIAGIAAGVLILAILVVLAVQLATKDKPVLDQPLPAASPTATQPTSDPTIKQRTDTHTQETDSETKLGTLSFSVKKKPLLPNKTLTGDLIYEKDGNVWLMSIGTKEVKKLTDFKINIDGNTADNTNRMLQWMPNSNRIIFSRQSDIHILDLDYNEEIILENEEWQAQGTPFVKPTKTGKYIIVGSYAFEQNQYILRIAKIDVEFILKNSDRKIEISESARSAIEAEAGGYGASKAMRLYYEEIHDGMFGGTSANRTMFEYSDNKDILIHETSTAYGWGINGVKLGKNEIVSLPERFVEGKLSPDEKYLVAIVWDHDSDRNLVQDLRLTSMDESKDMIKIDTSLTPAVPIWSRDGNILYFEGSAEIRGGAHFQPEDRSAQIFRIDRDGGNEKQITTIPSFAKINFALSPNEQQLVYTRVTQTTPPNEAEDFDKGEARKDLYLVNIETGEEILLAEHAGRANWKP